jgi:hypothetical protein
VDVPCRDTTQAVQNGTGAAPRRQDLAGGSGTYQTLSPSPEEMQVSEKLASYVPGQTEIRLRRRTSELRYRVQRPLQIPLHSLATGGLASFDRGSPCTPPNPSCAQCRKQSCHTGNGADHTD